MLLREPHLVVHVRKAASVRDETSQLHFPALGLIFTFFTGRVLRPAPVFEVQFAEPRFMPTQQLLRIVNAHWTVLVSCIHKRSPART